ncbi:ExbD/TolR family protein [Phycisphaera mikurensis NBRC 102666]|uniref:ExbD/TolR family protein n=2 Tax=Phycisphaera TaxID=666508 RepID=I0IHJ4_PHYMF|nr:ExbD/TolR family protein [Phycisphaera mikurensis NBRC 102666]
MHTLRRRDRGRLPRLDVLPLLDVVFLLLTYFIYAMAVLVRADALPVGVAPVVGAGGPAPVPDHVLTLTTDGSLRYNGEPLEPAGVEAVAAALAEDPAEPTLYVALGVEDAGAGGPAAADRGPRIWSLLQAFERAGLRRVALVGPPEADPRPDQSGPPEADPRPDQSGPPEAGPRPDQSGPPEAGGGG